MDVAEEVSSELVVAGGEAAAVFQAAEHALDGVAALVEGLAEAAFPAAVGFGRDVGDCALLFDNIADTVAVIGAVGVNDAAYRQACQQQLARLAVGRLSGRQVEGERSSTRGTPRGLFGSNGRNRSHCPSLSQNSPAIVTSRSVERVNHIRAAL